MTWQVLESQAAFMGPGAYVTGVAAGPNGYVVVGKLVSANRTFAAMWWSTDLKTWVQSSKSSNGGLDGRLKKSTVNAVAPVSTGFVAAGTHGTGAAIWTSANGMTWTLQDIPVPGASRATLNWVTVNGSRVAAGYAVTTGGDVPIVVSSADGGTSWQQVVLPPPGTQGRITALTEAGTGFIAAGQVGQASAKRAVTWSSQDGLSWRTPTIDGGMQEITALSATGAIVTGAAERGAAAPIVTLPAP
jgi:hypothetical protein